MIKIENAEWGIPQSWLELESPIPDEVEEQDVNESLRVEPIETKKNSRQSR